jgi:hypothetical protein
VVRARQIGPVTLLAKDGYKINFIKDTTLPEPAKIQTEFKNSYVLQENLELKIEMENGADLILNQETLKPTENGLFVFALKDGENKLDLIVKDKAGNESEITTIQTNNFLKSSYTKLECLEISFAINSQRTQVGFSGVNVSPYSKQMTNEIISETQKFRCEGLFSNKNLENDLSYYSLDFYPKGSKLGCLACGGGSPGTYIDIFNKDLDKFPRNKLNKIESNEIITKNGTKGLLTKYELKYSSPGYGDFEYKTEEFEFDYKGQKLILRKQKASEATLLTQFSSKGPDYYQHLDSDFQDILDTLVLE